MFLVNQCSLIFHDVCHTVQYIAIQHLVLGTFKQRAFYYALLKYRYCYQVLYVVIFIFLLCTEEPVFSFQITWTVHQFCIGRIK